MPVYILKATFSTCDCPTTQKKDCEHLKTTFFPALSCENRDAIPTKLAQRYDDSWGIFEYEIASSSEAVELDETCPMPTIEELHETYKGRVQIATHCPFDSIELDDTGIRNYEVIIDGPNEDLALSWKAISQSMERQEASWQCNPELWVRIPKNTTP